MTILFAGLVTFAFTAVLTIAGVGAAFILIPVFLALGIDLHIAMATALLLNAVAMSVASVNFVRKRLVVWNITLPILVVASLLSPVGAYVSQGLDRSVLLWLFIAFLVFAAMMMLFYRPRSREAVGGPVLLLGIGIGVGGLAGFLGGLLGVGGGNIIVPALVALGFDPKKASASTSVVVIFSSLAGFLGHATLDGLNPPLLGVTAMAAAGGAVLGSWLMTERLKGPQVKVIIGMVLMSIAAKLAWGLL